MPAKKTAKKVAKKPTKKAPAKKTAAKTAKKVARKATKKAAKTAKASPAKPAPTFEEIATVAFLKHLNRLAAGLPDDPTGDWLEAERELLGK